MSDEEIGETPEEQPDDTESDPLEELRDGLQKPVEGDGEEVTLSPEELERIRRSMDRIRRGLNPKLNMGVADLLGKSSFLQNYSRLADLARMGIPQSTLDALTGKTDAILKSTLGRSFMPKIDVEPRWMKQINLINSDAYRMAGLGQSNLTRFNSILAGNAAFDVNARAADMLSRFAVEQTSFLKRMAPLLESVRKGLYPANLRDIEGITFEDVEEVVMLDGIGLYGIPRQEIAAALISAGTTAARRDILGRRWKAISADCREALSSCSSTTVAPYLDFAVAALDALDAGNTKAAQAMAASVLDTVVNSYFGKQRYDLTPNKKTTDASNYDDFTMLEFIAFAPLWKAYQQYRPENGDPIPRTFSRHASVHGVSSRQFSRRNAVQAVLFVSSLLLFLDEEASAVEAA